MQTMRGMKHLGKAVRQLRTEKGLRLEDVANSMSRYDAGNLSRFERQLQDIEGDKLQELCKILGVDLATLANLASSLDTEHVAKASTNEPVQAYSPAQPVETPNPQTLQIAKTDLSKQLISEVSVVPVYKGEHLSAMAEGRKQLPQPSEFIRSAASEVKPNDFAWVVTDDSMTGAPGTEISYPVGAYAVFDPDLEPTTGDCVIVNLGGDNNTFTQLVNAGGRWMMVPLNKAYPARDLPAGARVLAVAVSVQMTTRRRR